MGIVCNACNAAVVPGSCNGAGPVGSVAVFFSYAHFIAVGNEIPAIHIVYIAVSVIVNAITGDLVLIDPDGVF